VKLPATFSWENEQRIVQRGEGRTRNISEKGVFVDAVTCPPIGSSVELCFSLPPLGDASHQMHVQHKGETLRLEGTEQGEPSGGFAITSREVVWRYEDRNNFGRNQKEQI
jgi:hypothetical protein